jgi:hypothetical protein
MTLSEQPSPLTSPVQVMPLRARVMLGIGVALAAVILIVLLALVLDEQTGVDWYQSYRPAVWELLSLRTPYTQDVQNPPWILIPMVPLALLPARVGRAAYLVISFLGFAYVAYRMGAKPIPLAAFLLSPPVLQSLVNANVDWLVLLGVVLPPHIGLFFLVIKPQIGFGVGLLWLVEAWQREGWREVIRVFGPVGIALVLSFVAFGLWPLTYQVNMGLWWNASLWPTSIPVGLVLLAAAIRMRKVEYALGAAPCLSPYVLLHSWSGALAALLRSPYELIAAVLGLWVLVLIRAGILNIF